MYLEICHLCDLFLSIADMYIIEGTDGSTRVKRGLFCSKDVWNLRNGDRIVVECNEHNQPDNRGGRVLGG